MPFLAFEVVGQTKNTDIVRLCAVSWTKRSWLYEFGKNMENKTRMAVWFTPSIISRMDGWLKEDNCKTRSEFIEKALRFYMGYLGSCDSTEYLSKALVTVI